MRCQIQFYQVRRRWENLITLLLNLCVIKNYIVTFLFNTQQVVLDKVEQISSSVEQMKHVVNALTNIIVTNNPDCANIIPHCATQKEPVTPIIDLTIDQSELKNKSTKKKSNRTLFTSKKIFQTPTSFPHAMRTPTRYYLNNRCIRNIEMPPRVIGPDLPNVSAYLITLLIILYIFVPLN